MLSFVSRVIRTRTDFFPFRRRDTRLPRFVTQLMYFFNQVWHSNWTHTTNLLFWLRQITYFNHTAQYKVSAVVAVGSFAARGRGGTEGGGGTAKPRTAVVSKARLRVKNLVVGLVHTLCCKISANIRRLFSSFISLRPYRDCHLRLSLLHGTYFSRTL